MRTILAQILFGLVAGGIAKLIMPGKDPGGCLVTSALGIVGALVGGWIGKTVFGVRTVAGFHLQSLGIAILGSLLLLLIYRVFIERRHKKLYERKLSDGRD